MLTGATSNGALNVNGSGLVFDREMGFGRLDAEAAVKLAMTWTGQSTAANEAASRRLVRSAGGIRTTSQSIEVTIDNPGERRLLGRIRRADTGNVRCRPQGPRHRACFAERNEGADRAQPLSAGNQTYLEFHILLRRDLGRRSVRHLDRQPDATAASDDFSVLNATIDIYGDTKGTDDTHYFTSSYERLVAEDPNRSTIADLNGGIDTLNFAAASGGS